jgi:hypothetical protein
MLQFRTVGPDDNKVQVKIQEAIYYSTAIKRNSFETRESTEKL